MKHEPDFSVSNIINDDSTPRDEIKTFGDVDFGDDNSASDDALSGFGHYSQLGESLFKRITRKKKVHPVVHAKAKKIPAKPTIKVPVHEIKQSSIKGKKPEVKTTHFAIPTTVISQVKELAKKHVKEEMESQGASKEAIQAATAQVEHVATATNVAQAVAKEIKTQKASINHPLMGFQKDGSYKMGGFFDDIAKQVSTQFVAARDTAVKSVATSATTATGNLINKALDTAAGTVSKTISTVTSTPQAQALVSQAATSGLSQLQNVLKEKTTEIWNKYKMPILVGGSALGLGLIYLIAKKKR